MNDDDEDLWLRDSIKDSIERLTVKTMKPMIDNTAINANDLYGVYNGNNSVFGIDPNIYNSVINAGLNMAEREEIIEKTIEKMKLLNLLTSKQQVKWLEEHPEDYKFIVDPDDDVKNMKTFQKDL